MELTNVTWRNLKSIYLNILPIKKLVDGYFECGTGSKEAYITSYEARHFLRRLVVRSFKELYHARKVQDIVLIGSDVSVDLCSFRCPDYTVELDSYGVTVLIDSLIKSVSH